MPSSAAPALMLPPLNRRLAGDLIDAALSSPKSGDRSIDVESRRDALERMLTQVSALACAAPWIRTLELEPVTVGNGEARVHGARIVIDPKRKPERGLPPHGDPSVSGGARRRSDVA